MRLGGELNNFNGKALGASVFIYLWVGQTNRVTFLGFSHATQINSTVSLVACGVDLDYVLEYPLLPCY